MTFQEKLVNLDAAHNRIVDGAKRFHDELIPFVKAADAETLKKISSVKSNAEVQTKNLLERLASMRNKATLFSSGGGQNLYDEALEDGRYALAHLNKLKEFYTTAGAKFSTIALLLTAGLSWALTRNNANSGINS